MSLSSEFSGLPPQSTAVSQTQQGLVQKHSKRSVETNEEDRILTFNGGHKRMWTGYKPSEKRNWEVSWTRNTKGGLTTMSSCWGQG